MARNANAAGNGYLGRGDTAGITTYPVTVAGWARTTDTGNNQQIFSFGSNTNDAIYFVMQYRSAGPLRARTSSGAGLNSADTANTFNAGWNHVFASANSSGHVRAILNGGAPAVNSTNTISFSGNNRLGIGALRRTTNIIGPDIDLAWFSVWDIELSDRDAASLATGIDPGKVRPDALVFSCPIWGNTDPELETWGRYTMNVAGTCPKVAQPHLFLQSVIPRPVTFGAAPPVAEPQIVMLV